MTVITTHTVIEVTRERRARAVPGELNTLPGVRNARAVLAGTVVVTSDMPRSIGKIRAAVDNTDYQGVGADA